MLTPVIRSPVRIGVIRKLVNAINAAVRKYYNFDGVDDHIIFPEITLDGDFKIEGYFATDALNTGANKRLMEFADDVGGTNRVYINSHGKLLAQFYTGSSSKYLNTQKVVLDNVVRKYTVERVDDRITIECEGATNSQIVGILPLRLKTLNRTHNSVSSLFNGFHYDIKIWKAGVLVVDFPFAEQTPVIRNQAVPEVLGPEIAVDPTFQSPSDWDYTEWVFEPDGIRITDATANRDCNVAGGDSRWDVIEGQFMLIEIVVPELTGTVRFHSYDSSSLAYVLTQGTNRILHRSGITGLVKYGFKALAGASAKIQSVSAKNTDSYGNIFNMNNDRFRQPKLTTSPMYYTFSGTSGVNDNVRFLPAITFSGNYEIWVDVVYKSGGMIFPAIFSGEGIRLGFLHSSSEPRLTVYSTTEPDVVITLGENLNEGQMYTLKVKRVGTDYSLKVDEGTWVTDTQTNPKNVEIEYLARAQGGPNLFKGVISNLRVWQGDAETGTPLHHWPIDEGSEGVRDTVGGKHGYFQNMEINSWGSNV